jgi:hypothetical protein
MPSFQLPPCPACSTISSIERPFWKLARHTAARDHRKAYQMIGCAHVQQVTKDPSRLYSDEVEIELMEDAWQHVADQLFEAKVAAWPVVSIERFRRELEGRQFLPGTTDSLPLDFEAPAAPPPPAPSHPRVIRDPASGETHEL